MPSKLYVTIAGVTVCECTDNPGGGGRALDIPDPNGTYEVPLWDDCEWRLKIGEGTHEWMTGALETCDNRSGDWVEDVEVWIVISVGGGGFGFGAPGWNISVYAQGRFPFSNSAVRHWLIGDCVQIGADDTPTTLEAAGNYPSDCCTEFTVTNGLVDCGCTGPANTHQTTHLTGGYGGTITIAGEC